MQKILIVDDVDLNRKIVKFLFKSIYPDNNDIIIDEAENGLIALNKMKTNKYDLVFLDIHMPVMNGDEVIKKFREFEKQKRKKICPVIALSGSMEEDDYDKEFFSMITDYIIKPIIKDKIIKVIQTCNF